MSGRPADEARRALREARSRAAQDPGTDSGTTASAGAPGSSGSPGGEPGGGAAPRPGDVAREALRKAVSQHRGSGTGDDDARAGEEGAARDTGVGQDTGTAAGGGEPEASGGPQMGPAAPGPADVPTGVPTGVESGVETDGGTEGETERKTDGTEHAEASSAETGRSGARAADVAREALRAARDDARRAREETEREGARRRRRARQKLVDDRAAAVRRARDHGAGGGDPDVRRLLSDAFRMPDLPDLPEASEPTPSESGERAGRGGAPSRLTGLLHGGARSQPEAGEAEDPTESPTAPRGSASSTAGARSGTPQDQAPGSEHPPPTPGATPGVPDSGVSPPRRTMPGVPAPGVSPTTPPTAEGAPGSDHGPGPSPIAGGAFEPGVSPSPAADTTSGSALERVAPMAPAVRPHWGVETATPRTAGPVASTTPRSMAAPGRDSDLRRTFPAFPAREGDRFAESWWGNAWVSALEQGALDVKRLERGRGYAEQGHVDAITVTPGLVLAYVQGSRPRPYRVQVRLRTLDDSDWDRFLEAAADRPGHIAALLDKEMPQSLAQGGVPLLPGPGDLEPRCSCPDRGHPCKHAAALCYQTARLLDADPFVLLLLRGRGERELLDALSRLSATRAARAAQDREPAPLPGVRAKEALQPRTLPPLPAPLPPPAHPEQPPAYPASPGGPDPFALDQLATDAAARAHALLTSGRDPVGQLTLWQDAVRLAAARPGSGLTAGSRALYSSLAAAAGRTPADLARAVAAWRQGGLEGLAVLEEPWDPPAGRFDRARPLLLAADLPAFRPWRNHLTHPHGHLQLRLGRDGLWYAYESEPGRDDWWPRGTPDLDPVGALTGLGHSGDL